MKKIILICLTTILSITGAKAQSYEYPKHELSVGYGYVGITDIASTFGNVIGGVITGDLNNDSNTGEISVQYLYNLNKTWGVGVAGTYSGVTSVSNDGNLKQKDNYIAVMPTVRANWFRSRYFGMYSRVAVGVDLDFCSVTRSNSDKPDEDKTFTGFAFHATPVGLEVGSRSVSGFFELGFGFQGIFMGGVRFGF